ncbi:MAG: tetratricopeptide repeat protein [Patescibacteria group bacterium]
MLYRQYLNFTKNKLTVSIIIIIIIIISGFSAWQWVVKPQLEYQKQLAANQERMQQTEVRIQEANPELLANLKQGISDMEQALNKDPENSFNWFQLGTNKKSLGDYLGAEQAFRQALAIDKESVTAAMNLGVMYQDWGKYQQSEDAYREIINRQPLFAEGYLRLAELYLSAVWRDSSDAEQILLYGLNRTRNNPAIVVTLARYYEEVGNKEQALNYYGQYMQLVPEEQKDDILGIIRELQK